MSRVKREPIRHKGYVARTCTVDLRNNEVNVTGAGEDEKPELPGSHMLNPALPRLRVKQRHRKTTRSPGPSGSHSTQTQSSKSSVYLVPNLRMALKGDSESPWTGGLKKEHSRRLEGCY